MRNYENFLPKEKQNNSVMVMKHAFFWSIVILGLVNNCFAMVAREQPALVKELRGYYADVLSKGYKPSYALDIVFTSYLNLLKSESVTNRKTEDKKLYWEAQLVRIDESLKFFFDDRDDPVLKILWQLAVIGDKTRMHLADRLKNASPIRYAYYGIGI